MNELRENIYGHRKRLYWIISNLGKKDFVIELGCGTGVMITLQLAIRGYKVKGFDFDEPSINYGRNVLERHGIDKETLKAEDIRQFGGRANVIIASEVLEHIPDNQLNDVLQVIQEKLEDSGKLLVTVPNGYGWFELESFVWFKMGVGTFLEKTKIAAVLNKLKKFILGNKNDYPYPSTLSTSGHVQRFTMNKIMGLLELNGFSITSYTGSVLFCGPFSNLLFTGIDPIMKLNGFLGKLLPKISSGFYISCVKK